MKIQKRSAEPPLIIGEACNNLDGVAFGGRSGLRLAACMGMTLTRFLEAFDRINLLNHPQGRSDQPKGHAFPRMRARIAAGRVCLAGRHAILAGLRVALVFGLARPAFLMPVILGRGEASCVVVPHPSGIVRWWNDAGNVRAAGKALRAALQRASARPPA